jgi:hypothetical protein
LAAWNPSDPPITATTPSSLGASVAHVTIIIAARNRRTRKSIHTHPTSGRTATVFVIDADQTNRIIPMLSGCVKLGKRPERMAGTSRISPSSSDSRSAVTSIHIQSCGRNSANQRYISSAT